MKVLTAKLYQSVRIGQKLETFLSADPTLSQNVKSLTFDRGILWVDAEVNKRLMGVFNTNIIEITVEREEQALEQAPKKKGQAAQ